MIDDLMPADTPEYMRPAWQGCIAWAISTPEVVASFRAETGNRWEPGRTPLEKMIDKATGVDKLFIESFVVWVNDTIWGPINGPEEPRES